MANYDGMVPTLLVGAGGIGGKIVSKIMSSLTAEQKEVVSAVCIDTNRLDIGNLAREGLTTIITSSDKTVQEYVDSKPEVKTWFPENPFLARKKMTEGAGQIRAMSRLAAEAAISEGAFAPLDEAIRRVRDMTGNPNMPDLKVIIVCSICGGTGAGLVVQLPYYIKHKLDRVAGVKSTLFRGYFVGPSITEEKNTEIQKSANYTNAYACLKELNAIYKLQTDIDRARRLNIPFFDEANKRVEYGQAIEVPYDFIFMFEKFNADGLSTGRFAAQLNNVARTITSQCFSIATGDIYGGEDNFIIPRVQNNGLDRFGSIALAKAIYPYNGVLNYIANKWIADTIAGSWCAIDREYASLLRVANVQTGGRGVEEVGTLGDYYIEKIEADDDYNSVYRKYYNQAHRIERTTIQDADVRQVRESEISFADHIMKKIESLIAPFSSESLFVNNRPEISRQDDIAQNYAQVTSKLRNIKNGLNQLVNKYSRKIVETIIPTEYTDNGGEPVSLPDYLKNLHPIAARYVLYTLKKLVDAQYDRADSVLSSKDYSPESRDTIKHTDFYRKTPTIETPTAALEEIESKLPDFLVKFSKDYKFIYSELDSAADTEYQTNVSYGRELIKKRAFLELSFRLDTLIKLYEKMFKSIERIEKEAASEANDFLYMHNANKGTEHYICASSSDKEALYDEVVRSSEINFSEIPQEATWSLAMAIYGEMSDKLFNGEKTFDSDELSAKTEKIFRKTVISSMIDLIKENTVNILDMNIIQAVKKQHWLSMDPDSRPSDYEKIDLKDCRQVFLIIETKAKPNVKYVSDSTPEERIYWKMNPKCFKTIEYVDVVDEETGKTTVEKRYVFDDVSAENALYSDRVGSNEIFDDSRNDKYTLECLRAVYCLQASQLNLYKRDGRAYECYAERVNSMLGIGRKDVSYMFGEGQITFVHPHLDKRWHIPTMLPTLDPHEEEERQTDIVRAFLLSIALRFCRITKDNSSGGGSVDRWMFYNKRINDKIFEKIYINNEPIGTSYQELLDAFAFNSAMVHEVLTFAKEVKRNDISRCDRKNYSELEQHQIVYNLTHTNLGTGVFDTENILIAIFKLYTETGDDDKLRILLTTLKLYLYDYAMDVVGHVNSEANIFYEIMIKACVKSFESVYTALAAKKIQGKAFEKLSDEATFIKKSHDRIKAFRQAYEMYL